MTFPSLVGRATRIAAMALALLGSLAISAAQAVTPHAGVWNPGIGLFDVGPTFGQVSLRPGSSGMYGGAFVCGGASVERVGSVFNVRVPVTDHEASTLCEFVQDLPFGALPAGHYSMEADIVSPTGAVLAHLSKAFEVKVRGTVCNVSPPEHLIDLFLDPGEMEGFVMRLEADPAYRASLGNITIREPRVINGNGVISAEFPPLADPQEVLVALRTSGAFRIVRYYASTGCGFGICPGNTLRKAIEFLHAVNGQYFYADDPAEIAGLDAVSPGAGWVRTGETFDVMSHYGNQSPQEGKVQQVYRFWNSGAYARAAHVFTVSQQECATLRDGAHPDWRFEGSVFWAGVPSGAACQGGTPLHRLYNDGRGGAPGHRLTTRQSLVDDMVAQGWIDEGVAMCVGDPTR